MPINLKEHTVYVESHKMEMVPATVVDTYIKQLETQHTLASEKLTEFHDTLETAKKLLNSFNKDI